MGDRKTIMWHQVEAEMLEAQIRIAKIQFFESIFDKLKNLLSVEDLEKYEELKKKLDGLNAEYEKLFDEYGQEWIE